MSLPRTEGASSDCGGRASQAAGLFFVSGSLLLFELTLTRLLSVTLWYHFASVAITMAMFGTALAGVSSSLEREGRRLPGLAWIALCQAAWMVVGTATFLGFDFLPELSWSWLMAFLAALAALSLPFVMGATVVLRLLRQRPDTVSYFYAFDLLGAAAGCVVFVPILDTVSGPTTVLIAAALAALGGLCLAQGDGRAGGAALGAVGLLAMAAVSNEHGERGWLRVRYPKVVIEQVVLYEKWNALGRLSVRRGARPFGWGISHVKQGPLPAHYWLEQDASAGSPLMAFDGDFAAVEPLRHDVTSAGYRLRPGGSTLVMGAGGGRDILAALACGVTSVTAVELNPETVRIVQDRFGEFTGRPYSLPGVRTMVAEGRSFLAGTAEKFDSIQISLIDSWAAQRAGSYVFAESGLYTEEAFASYLGHLAPGGVLSVSRWWMGEGSLEVLRLAALARRSLAKLGVSDASRHVLVLAQGEIATMLLSPRGFSDAEIAAARALCREEVFHLLAPDERRRDSLLQRLLREPDWQGLVASYPLELSPPTDDRPFFFHPFKAASLARPFDLAGGVDCNLEAMWVLMALVPAVAAMALLCLLVPLAAARRAAPAEKLRPAFLGYFACLGAGFMLVEVAMAGRMVVFLGHPTYSISVVLTATLLSSAAGSWALRRGPDTFTPVLAVCGILCGLLLPVAALHAVGLEAYGWSTGQRIVFASFLMAPAGFFMGMPFSLGLRAIGLSRGPALAQAWGANGAFSVFAGVTATWIAVFWGFSAVIAAGAAVYALAAVLASIEWPAGKQ